MPVVKVELGGDYSLTLYTLSSVRTEDSPNVAGVGLRRQESAQEIDFIQRD